MQLMIPCSQTRYCAEKTILFPAINSVAGPNPILRRENRIKSIHSSLAIEQNTLTLEQVSNIIDGRRVLGPPRDIREVKNAYEAYERSSSLEPYSVKNLLLAHRKSRMSIMLR